MDLQLHDKVIVVSGGGDGIGAAICERLVEEGAIPVIIDRHLPAADWLRRLRARQPALRVERIELPDAEACDLMVARVVAALGRVDGLVNNAGEHDAVGLEAGHDAFVGSLARNLVHAYDLAHACAPCLRRVRGAIVNVASKNALVGQGRASGDSAGKGGLLALTREWAAALATDGVRVNAVVPAAVMTPQYQRRLQQAGDPTAQRVAAGAHVPLGRRLTEPAEIADSVAFLLSPRASHITAQWLHVDGGYVHLDRALD